MLLTVAAGVIVGRLRVLPRGAHAVINAAVFKVFLPALICRGIGIKTDLYDDGIWRFIGAFLLLRLAALAVACASSGARTWTDPKCGPPLHNRLCALYMHACVLPSYSCICRGYSAYADLVCECRRACCHAHPTRVAVPLRRRGGVIRLRLCMPPSPPGQHSTAVVAKSGHMCGACCWPCKQVWRDPDLCMTTNFDSPHHIHHTSRHDLVSN